MSKFQSLLIEMEKAISNLREILTMPKNKVTRDSAIKRFELCFDLSWKTTKALLEEKYGIQERSPKGVWREAYQNKLISYDTFWLDLTDVRNETVHTYQEVLAEKVYGILPKALEHFTSLYMSLEKNTKN